MNTLSVTVIWAVINHKLRECGSTKFHWRRYFLCSNLNSTALDNKNNIYKNSPGLDSTKPINKRIKIRDLVLSSMSVRLNLFGLG